MYIGNYRCHKDGSFSTHTIGLGQPVADLNGDGAQDVEDCKLAYSQKQANLPGSGRMTGYLTWTPSNNLQCSGLVDEVCSNHNDHKDSTAIEMYFDAQNGALTIPPETYNPTHAYTLAEYTCITGGNLLNAKNKTVLEVRVPHVDADIYIYTIDYLTPPSHDHHHPMLTTIYCMNML